jgi:hypothetical protein
MAVDILWFGVIEKYLIDGDISEIERLVRKGGVPSMFGHQIADILAGKKHAPSRQQSIILKRIDKYNKALSTFKLARKKGSPFYEAYHIHQIGKKPKEVFTMQSLAQYLYPNYDKEAARNEMYKFIKKHNLPKL